MRKNKKVKIIDLGLKSYIESLKIQEDYFNGIIDLKRSNRKNETSVLTDNYLLLVEHPPVFTLGKSGSIEHLLVNQETLAKKGIEFHQTNRGGDITFHGFDRGVVYLHMQGACAGCPSSTLTLKMGIENLLRHYIPEVVEVRPVAA